MNSKTTTVRISSMDDEMLVALCKVQNRKKGAQVGRLIQQEHLRLVDAGVLPGPGDHVQVPVVQVEKED